MSTICLVRSTFPNKEEAVAISKRLLEARLIACANISEGSTAIYHWEDMIQQEQEVILLAKTTKEKAHKTIAHIKAAHSYQVPSIVAWEASVCDETFASWVRDVVAGA